MKRTLLILSLMLAMGSVGLAGQARITPTIKTGKFRPSPEIQRLAAAFAGNWIVRESFEISTDKQGMSRSGRASFALGPGFSIVENYNSSGSAGPLHFFALFWWDQSVNAYRLLTCANDVGCELRGNVVWNGNVLVNSWREDVDGQIGDFKDSFVDISPSAFRLISEGTVRGKTVWRVVTDYIRVARHPKMH